MARFLVIFGTTDGHTAKVAAAIGSRLRTSGHDVDVVNADGAHSTADDYDRIIVAASIHASGYQRTVARWVSHDAAMLNRKPTAFVSVCLGVLQRDPAVDRALQDIVDKFLRSTSWRPLEIKMVAGALKYRKYNFLKRWAMKRIAKKAGGGTDTSRDYEYTDWLDLERFVDRFSNIEDPQASFVNSSAST